MKRGDLIKRLRQTAKSKGLTLDFVDEGAKHTLYRIGTKQLSVPRQINEYTAQGILTQADEAK